MEFDTKAKAYNFYNSYAYKVDFNIRRSKLHREIDGKIKSKTFYCSWEGHHEKDKQHATVKSHQDETRFGRLARMKINSHQASKYHVKFIYIDLKED